MMRSLGILAFIPQTRLIPQALLSIHALELPCHVDMWFMRTTATFETVDGRWNDITWRAQVARERVLREAYDYLFLIDDDMILPSDALIKLLQCEADIAYGLTVQRLQPQTWSACLSLGETYIETLDGEPALARNLWGKPFDCVGCGSFCTLIHRETLQRLPFERRGIHCYDRYLAMDAAEMCLKQVCHTGVVCGHVNGDVVYYPDPSQPKLYREESLHVEASC